MKFPLLLLLFNVFTSESCSPGPRYGFRHSSRRLAPLVRGQFIPEVSETTIGASGPAQTPIAENSAQFSKLVLTYNPDVEFTDNGEDANVHTMTQRCKDRIDTLAVLVADRWPTVRLRITKAWEPQRRYPRESLHYEGRAVDLTTSDRDITKYGMLARLALEAGFDWVFYKSKAFIHASVRPDDSESVKYGGCFPATSTVTTKDGKSLPLEKVSPGDHVLAVDRHTGELIYSEVIMLMDKQINVSAIFLEVSTSHTTLTLTKKHMLFIANEELIKPRSNDTTDNSRWDTIAQPFFCEDLKIGQRVFTKSTFDSQTSFPSPTPVLSIRQVVQRGVVAPLTRHGTIVIDNTVASCYSSFKSETVAHASFALARTFKYFVEPNSDGFDMHWYARFLSRVSNAILPQSFFRFA